MQFSTSILALLLSLSLTSAIPTLVLIDRLAAASITMLASEAAPAAAPAGEASAASPQANGNSSAAGTACSPAVNTLALGIQSNIDDQGNELNTVTALGNILAQEPMDMTLYAAAQTSLLGFVTKGITIRQNNQKIAPAGNAALPGLAVVAMAQAGELNGTMQLAVPASGMVDKVAANKIVDMLKMGFVGGTAKNKENLMMATGGCTVTGGNSTAPAKAAEPMGEAPAKAESMPGMEMRMKVD